MENKVLEYKILGVVSKTNKFRVYIPEKNVSLEIPFRKDYFYPLVTMYTIIHKEEGSKYYNNNDIGYKIGDIITIVIFLLFIYTSRMMLLITYVVIII